MKKALIGMAVGAIALGATVVPASAGPALLESIWEGIDGGEVSCDDTGYGDGISYFEQLVLISGWADRLDTSGNGKPYYTVFAPDDKVIEGFLKLMKTSISELASQPSVVAAVVADHIANGSISDAELDNPSLTRITMRSGYVAVVAGTMDPYRDMGDVYVSGQKIDESVQYSNGWMHAICGAIDSTPQVPTEGLNALDTPKDGTPGGTNSLPNTL